MISIAEMRVLIEGGKCASCGMPVPVERAMMSDGIVTHTCDPLCETWWTDHAYLFTRNGVWVWNEKPVAP